MHDPDTADALDEVLFAVAFFELPLKLPASQENCLQLTCALLSWYSVPGLHCLHELLSVVLPTPNHVDPRRPGGHASH